MRVSTLIKLLEWELKDCGDCEVRLDIGPVLYGVGDVYSNGKTNPYGDTYIIIEEAK